jgi:hypothetical protein
VTLAVPVPTPFRCFCACGCRAGIYIVPGRVIHADKYLRPLCDACTITAGPDCTMRRGFIRRVLDGFLAWCKP